MRVLRKLVHKNVLKCLDILMTKNNVYIVTEFCKKGDLLSIVKRNGRIGEHQAMKWMKDIV
jgi:serine/threonine protein kinase